jgi:hypothetical protein
MSFKKRGVGLKTDFRGRDQGNHKKILGVSKAIKVAN